MQTATENSSSIHRNGRDWTVTLVRGDYGRWSVIIETSRTPSDDPRALLPLMSGYSGTNGHGAGELKYAQIVATYGGGCVGPELTRCPSCLNGEPAHCFGPAEV